MADHIHVERQHRSVATDEELIHFNKYVINSAGGKQWNSGGGLLQQDTFNKAESNHKRAETEKQPSVQVQNIKSIYTLM